MYYHGKKLEDAGNEDNEESLNRSEYIEGSDEGTEEGEDFPSQPENAFFERAIENIESAVRVIDESFHELKPLELAKIASKFITDAESAAKLTRLKPSKVILHAADMEPNALPEIRSILKENKYLVILLGISASKSYEKACKNQIEAINIFQSNTFLLIPVLLLLEIIEMYPEGNFQELVRNKLKKFNLSLEQIEKNKQNYEEALSHFEKARELLRSKNLELILAPKHIATLIVRWAHPSNYNLKQINQDLHHSKNSFDGLSKISFEFFLLILKSSKMLQYKILDYKEIFNLQMYHASNPLYETNMSDGKIRQHGYVSSIVDRAFRENDRVIIDKFKTEYSSNKNLKRILALEAEALLSLRSDLFALQTLFQRTYLPFASKQIAKLLNDFCTNDIFYACIVVWVARNKMILDLLLDEEILLYATENKTLALKIVNGIMRIILKSDTLEKIKNTCSELVIESDIPFSVSDFEYQEFDSKNYKILKTLVFLEEIIAAKAGMFDYIAVKKDRSVTVLEVRNKRETQEDRMMSGFLPPYFAKLTQREQELAILATFEELQSKYGQRQTEGVCVVGGILIFTSKGIRIVTFSLGDGYSFLVKRNGNRGIVKQLNKTLHKPNVREEQERIKKFLQEKFPDAPDWQEFFNKNKSRLKSSYNGKLIPGFELSLTGALGDTDHTHSGLTSVPRIYFDRYENADDVWIAFSCDGLKEKSPESNKWVGSVMLANREESTDGIAKALLERAVETHHSEDNITIAVLNLKQLLEQFQSQTAPCQPEESHNGAFYTPIYADTEVPVSSSFDPPDEPTQCQIWGVGDGHGTGRVAEEICRHFEEIFCTKVKQIYNERQQHEKKYFQTEETEQNNKKNPFREELYNQKKRLRDEDKSKKVDKVYSDEEDDKKIKSKKAKNLSKKTVKQNSLNPGKYQCSKWGASKATQHDNDSDDEENEEEGEFRLARGFNTNPW